MEILPGYTLIYGYLKTNRADENHTMVMNNHNIEIVSGAPFLKRVFGVAYEPFLENCEKYIREKLAVTLPPVDRATGATGTEGLCPSELLTNQMNARETTCSLQMQTQVCQGNIPYNNPTAYYPPNNYQLNHGLIHTS